LTSYNYNRFRYYSPDTGQFINQDSIDLLGGVNNYQYAPNPTGWIDPLGLSCKEYAEINMYKEGRQVHFTISSHNGMEKFTTEQQSGGINNTPASIVEGDFSSTLGMAPIATYKIPLPDSNSAIRYQKNRVFVSPDDGMYDVNSNSCLTHVLTVLSEGGVKDVPNSANRLQVARFLKKFLV
jgi:uncharacterized protein RhaS with RHS repeats